MTGLGLETVGASARLELSGTLPALSAEFVVPVDAPLTARYVGPVEQGQLADLALARPVLPLVDTLRARYHEVARLLAAGLPEVEVCRRLGMSEGQLEMLTAAPSFQIALEKHQAARDLAFSDLRRQINLVAEDALAAVHEKIQDKSLSDKDLVRITVELLTMDGYGAVQKHLVAHASTDTIERAKLVARELNAGRVTRGVDGARDILSVHTKAA